MLRSVRSGAVARFTAWTLITVLSWFSGPDAVASGQLAENRRREELSQGSVRLLSLPEKLAIRGRATQPGAPKPWQYSSPTLGGYGTWNLFTANHQTAIPVVSWGGKGGGLSLTLFNNTAATTTSFFPTAQPPVANGWTHSANIFLLGAGTTTVTVVSGDGTKTVFTQNVNGSFASPAGVFATLVRNGNGTYKVTSKHGTVMNFGANNKVATIVDTNSNTTTWAYNGAGHVSTVSDAAGRVLTFSYNASNLLTSVTDPLSRVFSLTYNASFELTRVTYPAPTMGAAQAYFEFTYSAGGIGMNYSRLTTFRNRRGSVWTLAYSNGSDPQGVTGVQDPAGNSRSALGGTPPVQLTLENGVSYTWSKDASGNLTSISLGGNPAFPSQTQTFTYDAQHNQTSRVTGRGYTWDTTYDAVGNVLTVEDPVTRTNGTVKETFTYNALSLPLTRTDALTHVSTYTYSAAGNLVTETDALSEVATHTYSAAGQRLTTTDKRGKAWEWTYDADGNNDTSEDPYSNTTTTTFNGIGWALTVTGPTSQTETMTYDNLGRLIRLTHPDSEYSEQTFDAEDALLTVTDENGKASTTVYNSRGWATSVTDPLSQTTSFDHDNLGRRTTLTNARSKTTTWTLDNGGQPVTITYPDSTSEQATYNLDGVLATRTDGRGNTVTNSYDTVGRLTGIDYPTGTDTTYSYLANDLRSAMTDRSGSYSWTYNARDEVVQEGTPNGTVSRTFDDTGNVLTVTRSGGGTQTMVYDDASRTSTITNGASETTTLTYDAASRISLQTLSTGAKVIPTYDTQRGWLEAIDHKKANNTLLARYEYTRDDAGHITATTQPGVYSTSYGYDNGYQLTSEARTGTAAYSYTYTYDATGNRLTKTSGGVTENYTYGDNNQVLTAGNKSYTHDNNGNMTAVTVGMITTNLTWDYNNKLTQIATGGTSETYVTNDLGLRVSKTAGGSTNSFLYNGAQVLADSRADYTHGGLTGLISERAGSTSAFYHGDVQGSTRGLTDASQNATDSRDYDAWGLTIASSGSNATPFGFVGGEGYQSESSGLKLLGARYYDSSIGRFISRDPLGYGGGDVNVYRYCGNNPANLIDPSGEFAIVLGVVVVLEIALVITMIVLAAVLIKGVIDAINDHSYEIGQTINDSGTRIRDGWEAIRRMVDETWANARRPSKQLRKEWEKKTGQVWPKDPNDATRNQDVSHKKPLGDGGSDDVDNIEPKPHLDHMRDHMQNGDFARWGARGTKGVGGL